MGDPVRTLIAAE
jgi:4-aminobutyrate aminotransferase-like enzyme